MAEKFTKFILTLAEDPKELGRFQANPDQVAKEAGLTPAEQAVLISRDSITIRDAIITDIGLELGAAASNVTIILANWVITKLVDNNPKILTFSDFIKRVR